MAKFKCELCNGKTFFSETAYQRHIKTNDKHKLFVCPVTACVYASHLESGLDAHFTAKHPRSRLWPCTAEGCFANFTSSPALNMHRRESHPDPVPCIGCEATFINDEEMELHYLAQHAQKHCGICAYTVYESDWDDHWAKTQTHRLCKECDLAFETMESYLQHAAIPHKQLRCKLCDASFLDTQLLEFHLKKSHNHCNICDTEFTASWVLAHHNKSIHSTPAAAPEPKSATNLSPWDKSESDAMENGRGTPPDNICTCSICNREGRKGSSARPTCKACHAIFNDHVSLQQHSLTKHPETHTKLNATGIPKCRLCQVEYKTPLALQQHILFKHSGQPIAKNASPSSNISHWEVSSAGTVQVENSAAGSAFTSTRVSRAASVCSNTNSPAINVASLPEATPDIQATSINPAPSFVSLSIASISDEVIVKPDAASFDDLISLRDDQSDIDGDKASVVSEAITVILEPTLAHAEPGMRATPSDEVPTSQANTDIQQALPRSTPIPTAEDLRQEANKSAGPPAPLMVMRCAWCKESPADPVLTMCGHMFCHGCLMPEVSKSLQCPSCKRPLFVRIDVPVCAMT